MRFLPLILKNCWRNRRRTFLTIASVSISMCLLGVMIAMYHALYLSDASPRTGSPHRYPQQDLPHRCHPRVL